VPVTEPGLLEGGSFALRSSDYRRLADRLDLAVRRARRSGHPVLGSITVSLPAQVDPSSVVASSRRPGEPWFCLEQPERGGRALAGLGGAICLEGRGRDRFTMLAKRWRNLSGSAVQDAREGPQGAGLIAMGGFAFAPDGGASPQWAGFDPASLVVPEVSIARGEVRGQRTVSLTLSAVMSPDDTPGHTLAKLERRLGELEMGSLGILDPAPTGRFHISSTMPPEHYEAAVARAVELIRSSELHKIVLAREVQVHAPCAYDPASIFGVLREAFPSCFVFCVGRGSSTLVAASPELLLRREGSRVSTLALAGSTRRSADPAVDDYLGERLLRSEKDREEQAIVTRRIERTLNPHALWVTSTPEPTLVKVANIQHLATPIRAQLTRPLEAIELLELMHPTPALGGEPTDRALELIPALEGLDRGWYAGPVGWTDSTGDGEFCVALRCALLREQVAHCYAGVGVVRDSDPPSELAETEIKLAALLPLLSG
jgi:salicylate biosynthesis isochorismate synthase/menaquinone-specific isochorismate synthase